MYAGLAIDLYSHLETHLCDPLRNASQTYRTHISHTFPSCYELNSRLYMQLQNCHKRSSVHVIYERIRQYAKAKQIVGFEVFKAVTIEINYILRYDAM